MGTAPGGLSVGRAGALLTEQTVVVAGSQAPLDLHCCCIGDGLGTETQTELGSRRWLRWENAARAHCAGFCPGSSEVPLPWRAVPWGQACGWAAFTKACGAAEPRRLGLLRAAGWA